MELEDLVGKGLRALFCIEIKEDFFRAKPEEVREIGAALKEAFADLEGRFGVKVLGTFDDDLVQCGAGNGFPFISYILADIPDFEASVAVTNLLRTPFKGSRLNQYMSMQTRVGHPLFFGTE
ncbi:hypothetical protein RM543_04930 [Roseicyclus sp. F158]|uniref:Uncharacterized protein n=1 Tax=Tropicimonas omnivorans TaxID=3075590 RepID=A0ABU3DEN4_9RHOB|nr:hypothetical protein [Roseicyclus sp. F158]MDT0682019.1 hypothetical protein [Roseicyclus sp. F158]